MRFVKSVTFAVFAVALALPAAAQTTSTQRIDQRQANQQKRIDQGVSSGALTPKEAGKLDRGQAKVQKMEDKATADGKVTAKERRRIEQAQDRQSKRIARQKHDRQRVR
ncbi:MAG: hypothetical protein O2975_02170 [Proteobacteria bacterium]|nr:hypothetical protein [Pseudomonadota bacterium]